MSKGRQVARWFRRGRLWVVHPPGWPKETELSFTRQDMMVDWAHGIGYVLKDMNPPKEARINGRYYKD